MHINRLDHATIRVQDLQQALHWYQDVLGMKVLHLDSEQAELTCQGDAADLRICSKGTGISSFAFGVDRKEDLVLIERRLQAENILCQRKKPIDRPGTEEILAFELPTGHTMEFAVGSGNRVAGKTEMLSDGSHRPLDIDHINLLGGVDPSDFSDFFRRVFDFKQSVALFVEGDCVGTWLRSSRLDHDIAYMRAVRPQDELHHIAFAVEDGNHYFRLADRLVENGFSFEFGPGRHMAVPKSVSAFGTNNFAYAFDPSGNRNEFSSGMKEYPNDASLFRDVAPNEVADVMNGYSKNMPDTFMTLGS